MLSIEQGKYYLQRQDNPVLGEILEMFHFRGEDEDGMADAQVSYFIYNGGLSWDDAYYSSYNFEDKCVEIPKFFWDDWLHTLFIVKNHVDSFLKPYGVSEKKVNDGVLIHAATDIENEDSPCFFIDKNTYSYDESVREKRDNFEDFEEIAVCVDRETIDVLISLAKKFMNEVKEQMKRVLDAPQGKYIPHIYTDWYYDEDENHNYKFSIPKNAHKITKGENIFIRPCVAHEEQISGTVIDCVDDGIIIHAEKRVDITDDYSIEVIIDN